MTRPHPLSILAVAWLALGLTAPLAGTAADTERRLAAGEVVVHLVERRGGGPEEGIGRAVIDAPPERVFAALTDFAHYREWVPFVTRSDARPQPDGSVLSTQTLDLPALLGRRHYVVRAVSRVVPGREGKVFETRWTYVPGSGNVVDQRGSWSVTGLGAGRSLATCRLWTDPGDAPVWLMNRATARSLPWILEGLRQQVLRERYPRP